MGLNLCKAVLRDPFEDAGANPCRVGFGFGFGGDANCSLSMWTVACEEMHALRLSFREVVFMRGVGHKAGDLMVVGGVEGMDFCENTCTVQGR